MRTPRTPRRAAALAVGALLDDDELVLVGLVGRGEKSGSRGPSARASMPPARVPSMVAGWSAATAPRPAPSPRARPAPSPAALPCASLPLGSWLPALGNGARGAAAWVLGRRLVLGLWASLAPPPRLTPPPALAPRRCSTANRSASTRSASTRASLAFSAARLSFYEASNLSASGVAVPPPPPPAAPPPTAQPRRLGQNPPAATRSASGRSASNRARSASSAAMRSAAARSALAAATASRSRASPRSAPAGLHLVEAGRGGTRGGGTVSFRLPGAGSETSLAQKPAEHLHEPARATRARQELRLQLGRRRPVPDRLAQDRPGCRCIVAGHALVVAARLELAAPTAA